MGKIQNIKKLAEQGKGNLEMIKYLLWVAESYQMQIEAAALAIKHGNSGESYEFTSFKGVIEYQRYRVDNGEISIAEYNQIIKSQHKYRHFLDQRASVQRK